MRSWITLRTAASTSGKLHGWRPVAQALSLAMGEKQTVCMRLSHSRAVAALRTSGVHKTPQRLAAEIPLMY